MRISWDGDSNRVYSAGVDSGVFYPQNSPGVPWNGLISVAEKDGTTIDTSYIDGQKYRNQLKPSNFSGTISAFTYPDEFEPYNGLVGFISGQPRDSFGFSYRTNNELHLVYNAMAGVSNDEYSSLGSTASPVAFQWDFTTLPVDIPYGRPSAHLVIMLDYANADAMSDLEAVIYGNDTNDPSLPDPSDVLEIFESHTTLRITDNGDGTWTADGPDDVITMLDSNTFQIDWPSAVFIDATSYTIRSL